MQKEATENYQSCKPEKDDKRNALLHFDAQLAQQLNLLTSFPKVIAASLIPSDKVR